MHPSYGKWTFPRKLIDCWIEQSAVSPMIREHGQEPRPSLLAAGSDDPSLGILRDLFEQQTKPASFFLNTTGSVGGLAAVRDGIADLATCHILDAASGEYNLPLVKRILGANAVVVQLFARQLGLVVARGNPMKLQAVRDLARPGVQMINRQLGSGTRLYLDQALAHLKINSRKLKGYEITVATHLEVGIESAPGRGRHRLGDADDRAAVGTGFCAACARALRRSHSAGAFLLAGNSDPAERHWLA